MAPGTVRNFNILSENLTLFLSKAHYLGKMCASNCEFVKIYFKSAHQKKRHVTP